MNLLKRYSLSCGAKIGKPFLHTEFFPLSISKYITLNTFGAMAAKFYDQWKVVLDFLLPVLKENGIEVIQLGDANEPGFQGVHRLAGQLEFSQSAYILKNSLLHLGTDSALVHASSIVDIPLVALYSVSPPSICGPCFGDKNKQICLEPNFPEGTSYSFNPQEPQKFINTIKPEQVVNAVCSLLNLPAPQFETKRVGFAFTAGVLEIIPNCVLPNNVFQEMPLTIRYDKGGDEQAIYQQLSQRRATLVTDKSLNVEILRQLAPHIERVVYLIKEGDDPNFAKQLQEVGLPYVLISRLSDDQLNLKKLDYFDYGVIEPAPEGVRPEGDKIGNKFKTGKRIISGGKMYLSYAHVSADKPIDNPAQDTDNVIDTEDFWKNSEHYYIYEQTN